MRKGLKQFVEEELRNYPETKNILLPELLEEIDTGPAKMECYGRSNIPGRPTEQKAIQKLTNRRLAQMERTLRGIEEAMGELDETRYKLVELMYWTKPQKLTVYGIGAELGLAPRTVYKYTDQICMLVACKIGLIDTDELRCAVSQR